MAAKAAYNNNKSEKVDENQTDHSRLVSHHFLSCFLFVFCTLPSFNITHCFPLLEAEQQQLKYLSS